MIPRSFEYFSPRTLDEAIALLQKLGPEAKLLSGGQSLIPMMKLRLVSPEYIVDINRIPGLDYISESDGHLKIGALAREHQLESSEAVQNEVSDTRRHSKSDRRSTRAKPGDRLRKSRARRSG